MIDPAASGRRIGSDPSLPPFLGQESWEEAVVGVKIDNPWWMLTDHDLRKVVDAHSPIGHSPYCLACGFRVTTASPTCPTRAQAEAILANRHSLWIRPSESDGASGPASEPTGPVRTRS